MNQEIDYKTLERTYNEVMRSGDDEPDMIFVIGPATCTKCNKSIPAEDFAEHLEFCIYEAWPDKVGDSK